MFGEAEAYERFMGRWSRLVAPALVEFAEVHDGGEVLDVGSGTGALSAAVRDATKTTRVVGIDPSQGYVKHANDKEGGPRVRFAVGDAQALALPDATFDRTMSLFVLNFVPDRARALAEMIRVTKPGGMVVAAVWDYGDGMEMLRAFWDEATVFDPAIAKRDEKDMPLCRKGELAAAWRKANLVDVHETALVVTLRFASFDDYWSPFALGQGPAGAYVAKLPADRRAELGSRLRLHLIPDGSDRPIEMRARAWAVRGIKGP
jgi:SAM-dependent methyltransferase